MTDSALDACTLSEASLAYWAWYARTWATPARPPFETIVVSGVSADPAGPPEALPAWGEEWHIVSASARTPWHFDFLPPARDTLLIPVALPESGVVLEIGASSRARRASDAGAILPDRFVSLPKETRVITSARLAPGFPVRFDFGHLHRTRPAGDGDPDAPCYFLAHDFATPVSGAPERDEPAFSVEDPAARKEVV